MSPRDLIFRVLLISFVRFSTTAIIWPQRLLVVRLSEPARSLEAIPDRWRTMHPEFKAPQIEIQLMKGLVSPDEKWMFANKYKYSGRDYDDAAKMTSTTDEKKIPRIENGDMEAREKEKENDIQDNIVMPDRLIPQIETHRIFEFSTVSPCPKGQREAIGRCKIVMFAPKMTLTTDEKKIRQIRNGDMEAREKKKENDIQDNIVMPDRLIPQIRFRNIIAFPTYSSCPEGQREDSRGRCRIVIM